MLSRSYWSILGMRNRTPAYGTICHVPWKMMWSLKTHATLAHDQPPFVVPNQAIRPNCNPATVHSTLALSRCDRRQQKGHLLVPIIYQLIILLSPQLACPTCSPNPSWRGTLTIGADCWARAERWSEHETNGIKWNALWSGTWHGAWLGLLCSALPWLGLVGSGLAWPGRDVINDFD